MPTLAPALLLLALLLARAALRIWLARRQIRHVLAHADAVPARFRDAISADEHAKAAHYTAARQKLAIVGTGIDAAAFVLLTWAGVLGMLAQWSERLAGDGLAAGLLFVALAAALVSLLELPLEWFAQFSVEARYGFNRMNAATFWADQAKSAALATLIGLPVLAALIEVMERAGPNWWLGGWALWCAFTFLLIWAYPRWIAPLFNRFTPLPEGELRERIGTLLSRTGFSSEGVFTMDGSRRSSHGNAYFTGFGRAKRVVFFDTLIERLDGAEIEAVLAHELGHFRLGHIGRLVALQLGLGLLWFAALGLVAGHPLFFSALGMPALPAGALHDAAALTLFALASPLLTFAFSPLLGALSRRHEFQADAFAARHARGADLIAALVKLTRDNASTLTPDPVYSAFTDSHPPVPIRIAALERLDAAAHG